MGRRPGTVESARVSVIHELVLVSCDSWNAHPGHVIYRRTESHHARNIWRARLKLFRSMLKRRLGKRHVLDHMATALPGRHLLEQVRLPIQRADASRTEDLVRRENEEIGVKRRDIDGEVRGRTARRRGARGRPFACANAMICSTGLTVPSEFET